MSNLMITIAVLITASAVFLRQRASVAEVRRVSAQLLSQAGVLRVRAAGLEQRQADLQGRLSETQDRLGRLQQEQVNAAASTLEPAAFVPPDPASQGGWPASRPYFYLPKKDLTSVGYRLFEGNRLTDNAALLFGMKADEREAMDAVYDEMWRKFRALEIEKMGRVEKPKQWAKWTWAGEVISYRIPSLENEAHALRASFESSLQQTLGRTRATYLLEAANDHIVSKLDELGQRARTVSFGQVRQADGTVQPWYGILYEGSHGEARLIQEPLDPDSQVAYYARLFGVDVPIKGE